MPLFAIGDPQTTFARFEAALERHHLLGADRRLLPDVSLISMGDHFDFAGDVVEAERSGLAILRWLASHPPEQVTILAGNHDLCRVMELAFETDASFAEARRLALIIHQQSGDDRAASQESFHRRFPHIPTPAIARVDYGAFSVAQRTLVQELLIAGRLQLARTALLASQRVLLTHAGVTMREIELLALPPGAGAVAIAAALNARLSRAVAEVAPRWLRGGLVPLDLAPLQVMGTTGREGGGLLYHRPACADRSGPVDHAWEHDARAPRRFDPSELPSDLLQVAGHSTHVKCVKELAPWVDPAAAAAEHASIRTLRAGPERPSYVLGVAPALPHGSLVLIDPALSRAPLETVELLALEPG